jgi:hypothetical protein
MRTELKFLKGIPQFSNTQVLFISQHFLSRITKIAKADNPVRWLQMVSKRMDDKNKFILFSEGWLRRERRCRTAKRANEYHVQGLINVWQRSHLKRQQALLGCQVQGATQRVTGQTKSKERESRGVHSSGVPVKPTGRRGCGGALSSSVANSTGVNAEWADRTGWGGGRENGLIQKPPQLLTCARRSGAPGQACRKKSSCGGGGARSKEGRGTWPEGARPLAPPRQGERPMAGTVTTRKHVRTHAHATRSGQARARKPANPALPTPSLRPITKRRLT